MLAPARRARVFLMLLIAALAMPIFSRSAIAAEPAPADSSLGKVPADAESFGTFLRMGEMVQIVAKSRAWNEIWSEPAVQQFWKTTVAKYNDGEGDFAPIKQFLDNPANKDLPALLGDALSNEFFVYAGPGTGDTLAFYQELIGGARYGPALQQLAGMPPAESEKERLRILLTILSENPERIDFPDIVMGFKVSDPKKVSDQLARLEPVLKDALKDTPLKGRIVREKVAGDDFLILKADGTLIPWDEIRWDQIEEKPGEFAPLVKAVKAKKLNVCLGVRQGYMILSICENPEHIAKFAGPGPKLSELPEMKPLGKYNGKPFTSIGFNSSKLLEKVSTTADDLGGLTDVLKLGLPQLDLPEDLQKAIEKDIDELGRSLTHEVKKPGSQLSFTFRTNRGWEAFSYDYTEPTGPEPKPLTLLNHVGGDPILATVWRSGTTVADYQNLAKWIGKIGGHGEKIIKLKVPDSEDGLAIYREKFLPLIKEFSNITEKMWIPALADGQEAFVLDAKLKSNQWVPVMAPADKPLPLLEPALVLGVSNPKLLEDAVDGYFHLINKLIRTVSEVAPPGQVPPIEIPPPTISREKNGVFAFYPIPPFLGIDKQLQPTGGLNEEVAVLALSYEHAARLMKRQPLTTRMAPLENTSRALHSASYFNMAGFMDAVNDWVVSIGKSADPDGDLEGWRIGRKVIRLLKVIQQHGSATYREGGVTVTHSETILADVEPEKK